MADIAILVAEEYERRIKNPTTTTRRNHHGAEGEIRLVPKVSILVENLKGRISGDDKLEVFKLILEPKSQIGVAASDGFFSA